ncbi:MAG: hypothetical protein U0263_40885 [Polyangiaceae bacterium]
MARLLRKTVQCVVVSHPVPSIGVPMSLWKFLVPIALLSAACSSSSSDAAGTGGAAGQVSSGGAAGSAGTGSGGAAGSGGMGAADSGSGGTQCTDISTQFASALVKAKQCSLFPGTSKCDLLVKKSLECGEYEFVDSSNTDAVAELKKLQTQWDQAVCDGPEVCGVGGYAATSATCEAGGQGGDVGHCVSKM